MAKEKFCDDCKEKCDWYKEIVARGDVPFGCLQEDEDEEE